MDISRYPLAALADKVGTPFFLYDAGILRGNLGKLSALAAGVRGAGGGSDAGAVQVRYAMKANSARRVLELVREAGLWIDAVSGNEVLRAARAGFAMGAEPPVVMLTADVFRDNALTVVLEQGVLPNVGSPGMFRQLAGAGYSGPIAVRANPGFGHGHVQSCDTGGPSSKHGIWHEDLAEAQKLAAAARLRIVSLHAHVGTGAELGEFDVNMRRLVDFFVAQVSGGQFPHLAAVNFGGGIPYPYRPGKPRYDLASYRPILREALDRIAQAAGRPIRVEIEPGRFPVAGIGLLVCRVNDIKTTQPNAKGQGQTFVMVDAGFNDLVRPAMYGAYHEISVVGPGAANPVESLVVAGPLCESGDVFTRDAHELLDPRPLPRPEIGDLLVLHDAGAYGAAMSSNYVSLGRAPQVMWDDGAATLIARRETLEDLVRAETDLPL
jgi:diaminopimelate decarboxylase